MKFENKKVIIFGLGSYRYGSGVSAAQFFIKEGARVLITDLKKDTELKENVNQIKRSAAKYKNQPKFILGRHRREDFTEADIVIRNPGVASNNKFLLIARKAGVKIFTDVSLFLFLLRENSSPLLARVIGITGTRGKSTTSSLLAYILKLAGYKVFLGGNLGYSPLNFLKALERYSKEEKAKQTYIILELSSWLAESLMDVQISPSTALITNIYKDHLNIHKTFRRYLSAKAHIFKYQKKSDLLFLNKKNKHSFYFKRQARSQIIWFSKSDLNSLNFLNLPGEHNRENISAALKIATQLHLNKKRAFIAIKKFKSLPGRLEYIANKGGVKFYNDTTATTPEATMGALKTLDPKYNKKVILIAGGSDKGLDYKMLSREMAKHVKALILLSGTASDKLIKDLRFTIYDLRTIIASKKKLKSLISKSKQICISNVPSMQKAMQLASQIAKPGDIVLMSPAAASFGIFKNEFDRGAQFQKFIRRIN